MHRSHFFLFVSLGRRVTADHNTRIRWRGSVGGVNDAHACPFFYGPFYQCYPISAEGPVGRLWRYHMCVMVFLPSVGDSPPLGRRFWRFGFVCICHPTVFNKLLREFFFPPHQKRWFSRLRLVLLTVLMEKAIN